MNLSQSYKLQLVKDSKSRKVCEMWIILGCLQFFLWLNQTKWDTERYSWKVNEKNKIQVKVLSLSSSYPQKSRYSFESSHYKRFKLHSQYFTVCDLFQIPIVFQRNSSMSWERENWCFFTFFFFFIFHPPHLKICWIHWHILSKNVMSRCVAFITLKSCWDLRVLFMNFSDCFYIFVFFFRKSAHGSSQILDI
jgi:hypothetical protein